jgi:hypothetical protein
MSSDGRARRANLVAFSDTLSVAMMTAIAGITPDSSRSKGDLGTIVPVAAKEHSWEISETGGRDVPLEVVIDRLFKRAFPMRESFFALRAAGCRFKVELVQWMSASDPHGPGFALDTDVLQFLAELGAFVDVDQYVD